MKGSRFRYDEPVLFLTSKGFQVLGDFRLTDQPLAANGSETSRCVLLSPGHEIMAFDSNLDFVLAKYVTRGLLRMPTQLFEFLTEFTDGGFLLTTNGEATASFALPRTVRRVQHPGDASLRQVLRTHRCELVIERKRGREACIIPDEAGLVASVERFHLAECVFRRSIRYVRMSEARAAARIQRELAAASAAVRIQYNHGRPKRSS